MVELQSVGPPMADPSLLQCSFLDRLTNKINLTAKIKAEILRQLFPQATPRPTPEDFAEFFKCYEAEIGRIKQAWQSANLAAETHADITHIASILSKQKSQKRPHIREVLRGRFDNKTDLSLNRSIDLTLRLWLMLNVREYKFKLQTKQPCVEWDDDVTLEVFISNQFAATSLSQETRETWLHPHFTAANLSRICGVQLDWTQSLENHLRLDRKSKVLWIYPHKTCLDAYQNSRSILPDTVVKETIMSLNLLFPYGDTNTEKLLLKHNQNFHQTAPFDRPRSLNLRELNHWTDRLLELYVEIYQAPPVSWGQLWADRRNPQQWYTFWIALVILLLTFISTIATVVQAWAAVYALRLQPSSMK